MFGTAFDGASPRICQRKKAEYHSRFAAANGAVRGVLPRHPGKQGASRDYHLARHLNSDNNPRVRRTDLERILKKVAKQINALDEASLASLWEKYAEIVARFEPSERWEEAVLILSMIQGMRYKNQLFNHHWAQSREPGVKSGAGVPPSGIPLAPSAEPLPKPSLESPRPTSRNTPAKSGKVLKFVRREDG